MQNQLHKLVIRLNEQAVQLGQDKRYLMNAMADISHQLKTPLTSVNIILSFLMEENLTYEERLHLSGQVIQCTLACRRTHNDTLKAFQIRCGCRAVSKCTGVRKKAGRYGI